MGISTALVRNALAEFDTGEPACAAAWLVVQTNEDCIACEAADCAALAKAREAFFDITHDRNSKHNAMMADLFFMRRIAALGKI